MIPRILLAATALPGALLLASCHSAPEADAPAATEAAAQTVTGAIAINAPWSRETAKGQDAGGAFMTIANNGNEADRLIGGSTPVAGDVQVHTVSMDGGVMRMRQLSDGLEIPAGQSVTLKPGSFHIMLMQLKRPLAKGEAVPLTLQFEKAGDIDVELAVQPIGSMEPMEAHND